MSLFQRLSRIVRANINAYRRSRRWPDREWQEGEEDGSLAVDRRRARADRGEWDQELDRPQEAAEPERTGWEPSAAPTGPAGEEEEEPIRNLEFLPPEPEDKPPSPDA